MAEIKIVMTDMDGTYMDNSFQANQQNLEATRKLAERGIPVCAVTARNLGLVRRMLHLGELETYCVNNNGCSVHNVKTGESLWSNRIPDSWLVAALKACDRIKDTGIQVEVHTGEMSIDYGPLKTLPSHADRENEQTEPQFRCPTVVAKDIDDILRIADGKAELIRVFDYRENGVLPGTFYRDLIMGGEFMLTSSNPAVLEIMAAGSSKRNGVAQLAKILGIRQEEVMCCGDGANDIGMISWAGVGVAMDNASDEVKAAADYVSCNFKQGGVAKAIEKYILNR